MLHKWTKSTGLPLTFQIRKSVDDSKPYDNFQGIGDNRIHSEYKAGKGSVIIELKPTFLETFSVGERTLKAEFNDAKFTILAFEVVNLPRTGDKNNVLVGLIALA